MVDPAFSRQRYEEDRTATRLRRRRLIAPALAAMVLIGGGVVWALAGTAPSGAPSLVSDHDLDELKAVQDQLASSQSEAKKLSEQLAEVTANLDSLRSSLAGIAARP